MSVEQWWNDINRDKTKARMLFFATLSNVNPTWTGLGLQPSLHSENNDEHPETWHDGFVCCANISVLLLIQNDHTTLQLIYFEFLFYFTLYLPLLSQCNR
jgi:hypothetical protein